MLRNLDQVAQIALIEAVRVEDTTVSVFGARTGTQDPAPYRVTSLIRERHPLGPYRAPILRGLGRVTGG